MTVIDAFFSFYESLANLPKLPNLKELNWSGNRLPQYSIGNFVSYFFGPNTVHFLHLNRTFKTNILSDLGVLLKALPTGKLWGLALDGSPDDNFSGSFAPLLQLLRPLSLRSLSLNNQQMTVDDSTQLARFAVSPLCELSCDGSSMTVIDAFFSFYESLFRSDLQAIGRPSRDILRLLGRFPDRHFQNFADFRTKMQSRQGQVPDLCRSHFLCKSNPGGEFDPAGYYRFCARFPLFFFVSEDPDEFGLAPTANLEQVTVLQYKFPEGYRGLSRLQTKFLTPPARHPRYPPSAEIATPDALRSDTAGTSFQTMMPRRRPELPTKTGPVASPVSFATRVPVSIPRPSLVASPRPAPAPESAMPRSTSTQNSFIPRSTSSETAFIPHSVSSENTFVPQSRSAEAELSGSPSEDEEETISTPVAPRPLLYEAEPPPIPQTQQVPAIRRLSVPSIGAMSPSAAPPPPSPGPAPAPAGVVPVRPAFRGRERPSSPSPSLVSPQKDAALQASSMRSPSPVFAPPPSQALFDPPAYRRPRHRQSDLGPISPDKLVPFRPGIPFEVPVDATTRELGQLRTALSIALSERMEMKAQIQELRRQVDSQQAIIGAICQRLGISPP
jgi:hypothetical protein